MADYIEKDPKENPEKYRYDPNSARESCLTIMLRDRHEEEQRALWSLDMWSGYTI